MKATPKAMAIRSFACIGTILLAGACGGGGGGGAPSGSAAVPILSPLERVIQVRAGGAHSCLLTGQGNALCWGDNTFGQLGDGTTVASATPVKVIAGAITLPFPGEIGRAHV